MNQVYLVIESNGESYKDYQDWPVAAFDDENKAKEYASKSQEAYDIFYAEGQASYILFIEEENNLHNAIPDEIVGAEYDEISLAIYNYIYNKYPDFVPTYSPIHTFKVSSPIPFNPS